MVQLGSQSTLSTKSDDNGTPSNNGSSKEVASESTSKKTPLSAETIGPNKPLKFRLDKLDREHPYLATRGLIPETIAEFTVGFCVKAMMAERIAIPIHN